MTDSIILQNVTPNQLSELISDGIKTQLKLLKKELQEQSNNNLLTRKETCEFLKIDSSTLWDWTNKGKVKAFGIGNKRYYKRFELLDDSLKPLKK